MNRRKFLEQSGSALFISNFIVAATPNATLMGHVPTDDMIIAHTVEEGGEWIPKLIYDRIFNTQPAATLYSDGSIFDFVLEKIIANKPEDLDPEVLKNMTPWRKLI